MTKKDFELIANVINGLSVSTDNNKVLSEGHFLNIVDAFAIALKRTNPRFNESRFETACKK